MSRQRYYWICNIASLAFLYLALISAFYIRYFFGEPDLRLSDHLIAFTPLFIIWNIIFFAFGVFEVRTLRRYVSVLGTIFSAVVFATLFSVLYFYFQPELTFTPRRVLLLHSGFAYFYLVLFFLFIKYVYSNRLQESVYVVDEGEVSQKTIETLSHHSYLGFRFKGFVTFDKLDVSNDSLLILPHRKNLEENNIAKLFELKKKGVRFLDSFTFYESLLRKIRLEGLEVNWFLENVDYHKKASYEVVKRITDIVLGVIGVFVFAITFPIVAILIKISSKGPIFFIQPRVGRSGKIFNVYKYRTMRSGVADNIWTSDNDPRITRIGTLLRNLRIDELPQFINLMMGNMSLVGPRPEQVHIVEELKKQIPFYDERHLVQPGITGWAQINDTYSASVEETKTKLEFDLYYIKYRSLIFDLEIILKTVYYVLVPHGK